MPPNFSHQVSFTPPQSFYGRLQFTCHDFFGHEFSRDDFFGTTSPTRLSPARLFWHDFLRHEFLKHLFYQIHLFPIRITILVASPRCRLCHYICHYSTYRK